MNQLEFERVLQHAPVLTEIRGIDNRAAIEDFLAHPGFSLFWGLLLGSRQAYYAALSSAPAGNTEEVRRIGVLQGTIKGIELVSQTALEQLAPSGDREGADR